jgi:hypothetical protein
MSRWSRNLLIVTAVFEAATGVALIVAPSLVGRLLSGVELTGVAIPVARVAGAALVGLGVACWPGPAIAGMTAYSIIVMLYLLALGLRGEWVGPLLWPAVVLHGILSVLLVGSLFRFGSRSAD